jgi:hypothetical protein
VWSALGGELKPSLDLVFDTPFVVSRSVAAGAPVLEQPRLSVASTDGERDAERPARRVSIRGRGPLTPSALPATQDETVVAGAPAKPGRTYRIRGYPRS